jgi:Xaa-Pro aminopeptidase
MRITGTLIAGLVLGAATASAQIPASEYAARRDSLMAAIDSGIVFAPGARTPVWHYPAFRQLPAFRYLTGYLEPDADLVMVKRGGSVTSTLFVPPTNLRVALYDGRYVDTALVTRETGLPSRYVDGLVPAVDSLAGTGLPLFFVADVEANEFARNDSLTFGRNLVRTLQARHTALDVKNGSQLVDRLRARRSPAELALVRKAVEISDAGHRAALAMIAPGKGENEVQATMEYTFRRLGADRPSYSSIVGSGPNSTVLHYDAGFRTMQRGEVVLMDVAAEYAGYAADVTRTVPVSGTYSADQRAIYQVVLDAQKAAEKYIKPGAGRSVGYDSALAVVKTGLAKLGLIESPDAVFDAPDGFCPNSFRKPGEACPQWYLFTYHGYGHGIGLDVHDPAQYSSVQPFTFQVGDAFTIEPGLYVRANALENLPDTPRNQAMITKLAPVVERYKNIGVRIEDDYFVTPTGVERVSQAPREMAEIEAAMRKHPQATH